MHEAPTRAGQGQDAHGVAPVTAGVTLELVREVTERVYALLLAELKRERERMPLTCERSRRLGEG